MLLQSWIDHLIFAVEVTPHTRCRFRVVELEWLRDSNALIFFSLYILKLLLEILLQTFEIGDGLRLGRHEREEAVG